MVVPIELDVLYMVWQFWAKWGQKVKGQGHNQRKVEAHALCRHWVVSSWCLYWLQICCIVQSVPQGSYQRRKLSQSSGDNTSRSHV